MGYQTRKLKEFMGGNNGHAIHTIMQDPIVKQAMRQGSWIAGGMVRQILMGHDLKQYFWPEGGLNLRGDIDIFSSSEANAKKISEIKKMHPSQGGFASECSIDVSSLAYVKVQIVNDPTLCYDSVEKCLDAFDFTNCKGAIVDDLVVFDEDLISLESERRLRITNSLSPFMGSRVIKYMKHRGMTGITEDSVPHLTDWLIRAAATNFPGFNTRHVAGIKHAVMNLSKVEVMRQSDHLFFLGKWTDYINVGSQNYGPGRTIEVDWAAHEMSLRSRVKATPQSVPK